MLKTWLILGAALVALSIAGWYTREACPRIANERAAAGWTAYRRGDMTAANVSFREAGLACRDHIDARVGQGYVDLRVGQPAAARERFDWVLARDPKSVDALVGDGIASYQLGDLPRAWEHLTRARGLAPDRRDVADALARFPAGYPASATPPATAAGAAAAPGVSTPAAAGDSVASSPHP